MRLEDRPRVGRLVVPYVVDATRDPIDFRALDPRHVERCARDARCGICGGRIRPGRPVAFIGPDDGRACFADPWMHPACARVAAEQCPFVAGRRDWREAPEGELGAGLLAPYSGGLVTLVANAARSHRDRLGNWHFEALGRLSRAPA